jgi:hypothetical protein
MGRHLESCRERERYLMSGVSGITDNSDKADGYRSKAGGRVFLIKATSRYSPQYWLFLEANARCRLQDVDSFLRGIWLECCGHLSHFIIDDEEYESSPDPDFGGDKDMRVALASVLEPGMTILHEYDYGSTTELVLKVVELRPGKLKKGPVTLAARNDPVHYECVSCKKAPATDVCSMCTCERPEAMFCASCLKRHKCGEDMALPIVNSPRTGVCGYTG